MDATMSRRATKSEQRELRRLCQGWDRTRWDRTQAAAIIVGALIVGYIPVLTGAIWLAHR